MKSNLSRFTRHGLLAALSLLLGSLIARAYDTSWIASNQPISAAQLKTALDEAQSRIAALETATGTKASNDCPSGYSKDASETQYVVCKKGVDEIVKVGSGPMAFWIDRFEASVWQNADGTGTQYPDGSDPNFPLKPDGQYTVPAYAVSSRGADGSGVVPVVKVTWFQAQVACRLSGKRLPSGEEWLFAGLGTPASPTDGTVCNNKGVLVTRKTGLGTKCVSNWGAQDMVGNLWETTLEWVIPLGNLNKQQSVAWGTGYPGLVENIASTVDSYTSSVHAIGVWNANPTILSGLPAAARRGGGGGSGDTGLLSVDVRASPLGAVVDYGLRCAIAL
jgi:hypothetical protein